MPRLAVIGAAAMAAAFAAACGSTPSSSVQRPADPKQAVLTAASRTAAQSFRADMTLSETMHATGTAPHLQQVNGQTLSIDFQLAEASPQHAQVNGTVSVLGKSFPIVAVVIGQTTYVSIDGGKTFHKEPAANGGSNQYNINQALDYLNSVGTVTDAGAATVDGVSVERYTSTLDPAKMRAVLQKALSSLQSSLGTALQSIDFTGGTINAAIDGSDRLVTEDGTVDAAIDLGSVDSAYAGSKMTFHITINAHFHDYGASITVTPPPIAPPAP